MFGHHRLGYFLLRLFGGKGGSCGVVCSTQSKGATATGFGISASGVKNHKDVSNFLNHHQHSAIPHTFIN